MKGFFKTVQSFLCCSACRDNKEVFLPLEKNNISDNLLKGIFEGYAPPSLDSSSESSQEEIVNLIKDTPVKSILLNYENKPKSKKSFSFAEGTVFEKSEKMFSIKIKDSLFKETLSSGI